MKRIFKLEAPAKINLVLEVVGKRPDGYHRLRTVMLKQNRLKDFLKLEICSAPKTEIILTCDAPGIPLDEKNICHQAAKNFLDSLGKTAWVKMDIQKKIPFGAGLGGGSSDGAAVFQCLNDFFGRPLKKEKLVKLASAVGKDIPFFLEAAEAAWMIGLGEKLHKRISPSGRFFVLLVKPPEGVSTAMAYGRLAQKMWFMNHRQRADRSAQMAGVLSRKSSADTVAAGLYNDFETSIESQLPIIKELKQVLLAFGADGALMSGSGSAVFGIFSSEKKLKMAEKILRSKYPSFFVSQGR